MNILIPKSTRLIPHKAQRLRINQMVNSHPPGDFESYWDWFYFLHLDPISRFIHWVGMILGFYYYYLFIVELTSVSILHSAFNLGFGFFCFYCFGLIAHLIYDKGAAKSDPKFWHITLWGVIYINLATMSGLYGKTLRAFIKKYPWAKDEWELEEKSLAQALLQIIGLSK